MTHITENDYKKLAEAVADDLILNKIPLNDSVSKLASSMDMSQEQVKRLCETTNNSTFGKLFHSKDKTASDRIVEFEVADANKVLNTAIKQASVSYTPASTESYLLDYAPLVDSTITATLEIKTAFELRPESTPRRETDTRVLQKTLNHLRSEKTAAELEYIDTVTNISNEFKRLYPEIVFTAFEKSALALHGESACDSLAFIRDSLGLPAVTYNIPQIQKTAGVIDTSAAVFTKLAHALDTYNRICIINKGIEKVSSKV